MSQFYDQASLVMVPSGYKAGKIYSQKPLSTSGELSFSRASNATRVNSSGLVEKVRTNNFPYSQDFFNAGWGKEATMTETFSQTDPNGGTTGVLLTSGLLGNAYYSHGITCTANVPNTFSIYIKGNASGSVSIRIDDSTTGPQYDINYTTSWQRFSVTRTPNQTGCSFVIGGFGTWAVGENLSFAFAQLETGDIATDYIATTSAAVSVGPVSGLPRLDYSGGASCPSLLLEPQRTNVCLWSESFDNAAWGKGVDNATVTVTANQSIAPDGTMSADKVVLSAVTGAGHYAVVAQAFTATAAAFSGSFYFKGENGGEVIYISYTKDGVNYTRQLCTLTTSWQRFTLTSTLTAGADNIQFGVDRRDGSQGATPAQTFYAWGAQVEAGAYATSYIPTLSSAVTRVADDCTQADVSGLLGAATGTAFIDFVIDGPDALGNIPITIGATTANLVYFFVKTNTGILLEFYTGSTLQAQINVASPFIVYGTRYKAAFAWANNDFVMYINGLNKGTATSGNAPTPTKLWLGQYTGGNYKGATINQTLLFPNRLSNADLATLTA